MSSRRAPQGRAGRRRPVLTAAVAAAVLAADQVTKQLAVDHLAGHPAHLVGPLSLELSYNSGVAFSLGAHQAWPAAVAAAALLAVLAWVARSARSASAATAAGLVVGGALGNLADRLVGRHAGSVVDFIRLGFWPTFNLADSAIVVGCALLLWRAWRQRRAEPPPGTTSRTAPGAAAAEAPAVPDRAAACGRG